MLEISKKAVWEQTVWTDRASHTGFIYTGRRKTLIGMKF